MLTRTETAFYTVRFTKVSWTLLLTGRDRQLTQFVNLGSSVCTKTSSSLVRKWSEQTNVSSDQFSAEFWAKP